MVPLGDWDSPRHVGIVLVGRQGDRYDNEVAAEVTGNTLRPGELAELLERTSRTFALTIPLLEEPLASDVGIAYLLLRLADTLEDAPLWNREPRVLALDSFGGWVVGDESGRTWLEAVRTNPPTADEGCLALLSRAEAVRNALLGRGEELVTVISLDIVRTSSRMAEFVRRQTSDGSLRLGDLADLKAYCYAVAGIVGELLTELFLARYPSLEAARRSLMSLAPVFGEGLQLVNILKDATKDASEGRIYLPRGTSHAEIIELARADLARANEYVSLLARNGAPRTMRAFCTLPIRLAEATLDRLESGDAKLTRSEVMSIFTDVTRDAHLQ